MLTIDLVNTKAVARQKIFDGNFLLLKNEIKELCTQKIPRIKRVMVKPVKEPYNIIKVILNENIKFFIAIPL